MAISFPNLNFFFYVWYIARRLRRSRIMESAAYCDRILMVQLYKQCTYKTRRFIESFGYCYRFYVGLKYSYFIPFASTYGLTSISWNRNRNRNQTKRQHFSFVLKCLICIFFHRYSRNHIMWSLWSTVKVKTLNER